jgi:hypothetical protein
MDCYWYARGYFDGRTEGVENDALREVFDDATWHAYKNGYQRGVSDYCSIDLEEDKTIA